MQLVKFFVRSIKFLFSIEVVSYSLLVVFEESVVFGFVIFSFWEFEAGYAEIVFEPRDFGFVSVDFSDVELDIVAGGWLLMELAFGVLRSIEFLACVGRRTLGAGRTAGLELA